MRRGTKAHYSLERWRFCTDYDMNVFLWREGDEKYYSEGVDAEDYRAFKFTAETENYCHALGNSIFSFHGL